MKSRKILTDALLFSATVLNLICELTRTTHTALTPVVLVTNSIAAVLTAILLIMEIKDCKRR